MQSIHRRIILAFGISALCLASTHWWYISTNDTQTRLGSDEPPLARLLSYKNEVLSRPAAQIMWFPSEKGSEFVGGDAIRTSAGDLAVIELIESNRTIEIDGDTLIVFEKNQDEISLELIQGQVVVNSPAEKENRNREISLSLRSGKNSVDLSRGSAQLQSDTDTGGLRVEALSGEVTLSAQGSPKAQKIESGQVGAASEKGLHLEEKVVELISPAAFQKQYSLAGSKTRIPFRWRALSEEHRVRLLMGKNPNTLTDVPIDTGKNEVEVELGPGTYYWKLIAENEKSGEQVYSSTTYRTEIEGLVPPTPIAPANKARLYLDKERPEVSLQWTADSAFDRVVVQVASDPQFLKEEKRYPTSPQGQIRLKELSEGRYYWRVIGYRKETGSKPEMSRTHAFLLSHRPQNKTPASETVATPEPITPPEPVAAPEPIIEPPQPPIKEATAQPKEPTPASAPEAPTPRAVAAEPPETPILREPEAAEDYKPLEAPRIRVIEVE